MAEPATAPAPAASAALGSAVSIEETTGERRLDVLDGLRGLAILMVVAFHYTVRWAAPIDITPGAPHFQAGAAFVGVAPLRYGWIGVPLFFCISGFVILLTLERCASVADFAARRAARLWPPMLVAATAAVVVVRLWGPADWRQGWLGWLLSIFFVSPNLLRPFFPAQHLDWVDTAYWSLWVEVRFYALAAVLHLLPQRWFLGVLFALEGLGAVLHRAPDAALQRWAEALLLPNHLPYFVVGICGYLIFMRRASPGVYAVLAVSAALILGAAAYDFQPNAASPLGATLANAAVLALFAAFVFRAPGVGAFAWRPPAAVGRASYSFYLLHQMMGMVLIFALLRRGAPLPLAILAAFALFLALAFAMFALVEQPAKAWVHRHSRAAARLLTDRAPWTRYRPPPRRAIPAPGGPPP